MINKENADDKPCTPVMPGYIDIVDINVQCHLIIKDKDTGEVLVNKRG